MNRQQLIRATDEIATREAGRFGYGYADTQSPWHHDPAIEQCRTGFHEFLDVLRVRGPIRTVVQIGLGRHGGGHLALREVASRVVTIERDAERVAGFAAGAGLDPDRDVLVVGDSADPQVAATVRSLALDCDVLLIDGADSYEGVRSDWQQYGALVRVGGMVAIVDRSQAQTAARRPLEVDDLIADLERDCLLPCGVRWRRFGGAHVIHAYVQTAATSAFEAGPDLARGFLASPVAVPVGEVGGWSLFALPEQFVAVPVDAGGCCPRRLVANEYPIALVASSAEDLRALAVAWDRAEPRLEAARAHLQAGEDGAAREAVRAVTTACPGLREALIPCLEATPWNRRLLMALGMLGVFGGHPREGVMLLRRTLCLERIDSSVLATVAAAYLRVLQDEAGARELLTVMRQQVRRRKVATVCQTQLRGQVLWHYPQLLQSVQGVLQVGAHRGEDVAAWCQLEIPNQVYVEANPEVFDELERTCRGSAYGHRRALLATVGALPGTALLRFGDRTAHASLLPTHPLASLPASDRQHSTVPVMVTTLDDLVASGAIDARACDLLYVDTEGTELEVLRGATELLRHVDVICVSVFLQPVYTGVPMPQEIQTFLHELHDGCGFGLRAFEPCADGMRGQAVFRRIRER